MPPLLADPESGFHPANRGRVAWADRACADDSAGWFHRASLRRQAATLCGRCPVATACLVAAMRLDAAHRRGRDAYGATGLFGGWWFSPGEQPVQVDPLPLDAPPRVAA